MSNTQSIRSVLISVYHKTGLEPLLSIFKKLEVRIISTGGTAKYLREKGLTVEDVSKLTGFPEILDGRVKTLHPLIFGGLLAVRGDEKHMKQIQLQGIPEIDVVIVDLYPFAETRSRMDATEDEITEQIDIGGVSLIRAAAKNHRDVCVISSHHQYGQVAEWLEEGKGALTEKQRQLLAAEAFRNTAAYDIQIGDWLSGHTLPSFATGSKTEMRYGENPHQQAAFYGNWNTCFHQRSGKTLSYNNLNDLESAVALIREFKKDEGSVFAIIKHTNACGLATGKSLKQAWERALACDPASAFGGVLACNRPMDLETAEAIHPLFFEVIIAPAYSPEAFELLASKKNRIILEDTGQALPDFQARSLWGGMLVQEKDKSISDTEERKVVCGTLSCSTEELDFAEIAVKHLKSNAIVLVKNGQMIGSGAGHTSRVDAVRHAIAHAHAFGFKTKNALLASDAFFPFPDNLELAAEAGIRTIMQPGGSVKDDENIAYCRQNNLTMVFTGKRHFKH